MSSAGVGRIFISYRRSDASDVVGRLHDRLSKRFGRRNVFVDVDMQGGEQFPDVIAREIDRCEVLLAIIGPQWLSTTDQRGRRRLDDPHDLVRTEIEAGLRGDVRVIPILTNGAAMPGPADLPDEIADLSKRHSITVRHESFHADTTRILSAIEPLRHRMLSVVAGSLLLLAGVSFAIATRSLPENLPILVSDTAVVAGLGAAGVGLLRTRRTVLVAAGFLFGIWPFAMLRIWRSAELRGASTWASFTLPVLAMAAALVLVAVFLLSDAVRWFGYFPPHGDAVLTIVPIGAFTCVALAAVGSTIPASASDFGTMRFSDPTISLLSGVLALLVLFARRVLRGAILAGWACGAATVLAHTIWLRYYSGFSLPPVMGAQVLLSGMTFVVLIAASALTLRQGARRSA